jgi:phage/plasmid-like protein (TIGR03299 family)
MAHQIDTTSLNRASYASTQREWHGLGELMPAGQDIETWAQAAGMEYKVQRAVVRFATQRLDPANALIPAQMLQSIEDKLVLFRSDTGAPLGVVSDSYKVVQPREVLEFFREWAQANACTIESAGVLFGGKRYFATAKLSEGVCVDGAEGRDKIVPYVLLSTSADGSLATEGRITTVRVVCNNTLRLASKGASSFRVSHRTAFKAEECRTIIESAHEEFGAFMDMSRKLASIKVESRLAEDMTTLLLTTPTRDADAARDSAGFTRIMSLFQGGGKGSTLESSRETAWGWLNSATEFVDHHVRARSDENRTAAALWGPGADLKQRALDIALAA